MNRLGWIFLGLFGAIALLAVLFVDFDEVADDTPPPPDQPVAAPVDAATIDRRGPLTLPVAGVPWERVSDSWGEARGDGTRGHTGTDIMAPGGTPVVAAADGTVEKLFFSAGGGGITTYVRSPDRRLSYYYAHLAGYAPNLREGATVRAGQTIGYVGDTGNAGRGDTHLHFGIERLDPSQQWHDGQAVDPYPLLARGRSQR